MEGSTFNQPTPEINSAVQLERNPNFKTMHLDSINEDVLRNIFEEILKKAELEIKIQKFIPFTRIETIFDINDRFSGSFVDEHILLNEAYLSGKDTQDTSAIVLETIVHEEIHALSDGQTIEGDMMDTKFGGFHKKTIDPITKKVFESSWNLFNEGATELIKDEVLVEYLKRTGNGSKYGINGENLDHTRQSATYKEGRYLFMKTVESIALETGVPMYTVREAFVQAYFSHSAMDAIQNDFEAMCGKDLLIEAKEPNLESLALDLKDFKEMDKINLKKGLYTKYFTKAVSNYVLRSLI